MAGMRINQLDLFCCVVRRLGAAGVPAMTDEEYNRILGAINEIAAVVEEMEPIIETVPAPVQWVEPGNVEIRGQ